MVIRLRLGRSSAAHHNIIDSLIKPLFLSELGIVSNACLPDMRPAKANPGLFL